jgi:nitrogen-specific signal transduction histidine kinase/ActR/RegA family two-component response regulator
VVHAYVEDTTARLQLEEQLRHSQRMESIGQLAAGVAHDFNNMLTVMQGHSGMMLARGDLSQELHDSAQAIFFAAERATSLTRQLLMFSRKNVIQRRTLDLREVVSQMSKLLQRLLGETVRLDFARPAELPLVNADAGMVEQVVMNLCVNSRDAMPKGGVVTVSVEQMAVSTAYPQCRPEARPGNFVMLRVTDTGTGMTETTIKRIFEPFFTTKEPGKGTGLGLATVYGIARQHDGWVEVSSELGKGSEFRVFFPANAEMAVERVTSSEPPAPVKGGRETVLVVEDEEVLRDLAHMILESCGYEVLRAGSGPEALRLWESNRPRVDLVLTDMVMPEGMTGTELAQQLLATKPSLRVIIASGYSLDETDASKLPANAVTYLQKPYTHVSLSKAVRESLDARRAGNSHHGDSAVAAQF